MIENVENYNKVFLERIDKFNLLMVEKLNEVKNTNQILLITLIRVEQKYLKNFQLMLLQKQIILLI